MTSSSMFVQSDGQRETLPNSKVGSLKFTSISHLKFVCQKCKGQYLAPAQWSTAVQERTIIVFICDTEMWRVHFQRALQITL